MPKGVDTGKCPAPAGMIPDKSEFLNDMVEMPRTCGDDPRWRWLGLRSGLNAPHLRG